MKISRNSFVKKYKALKNCNKQTALLKWKKLLLHFGFDISLKTLKFGMYNDANTNQAVPQQVVIEQPEYIAYSFGDNITDYVIVVNSVKVAVGEVKRLGNQRFVAENYIWGPSVIIEDGNEVPIEYQNIQEALNSLGFGVIHPQPFLFNPNNNQNYPFISSRFQDASEILNYDYLTKCTEFKRIKIRGGTVISHDCQDDKRVNDILKTIFSEQCKNQLKRYLKVNEVEFRVNIGTDDYYFNFHEKDKNGAFTITNNIDTTANAPTTTRKYHLSFHKPPSRTKIYAYHFKIEQLIPFINNNQCDRETAINLVFDIVTQKLDFQDVPNQRVQFPFDNPLVIKVLDCLKKQLNILLYGQAYEGVYPKKQFNDLMNVIKGKIEMEASIHSGVSDRIRNLETRITNRIAEYNRINPTTRMTSNFNFEARYDKVEYLSPLIEKSIITRHDIEDMFFIKGLKEYPEDLRTSLWPRTNVF